MSMAMAQHRVKFVYDPLKLIELIKVRPCIWDKNVDEYKNRMVKTNAWNDIYRQLEPGYDDMLEADRIKIADAINEKWRNLRDAFVRSIRKSVSRKYLYFRHMKFLMKVVDKDESGDASNAEEMQQDEDSTEDDASYKQEMAMAKRKRRKPDGLLEYVQTQNAEDPLTSSFEFVPQQDEDMSFFSSVLPCVAQFNQDEKLEFRMEVLSAIQRIRQKRRHSHDVPVVSSRSSAQSVSHYDACQLQSENSLDISYKIEEH